ncbi:hypothetical protein ABC977_11320 [Thioalkalicoccus limnaeus]|uniref:Tetratricopeptide repeat protein n=1 Tax=Thioalkalicoccus limnaeus TaxID=120681 RepID=A0ABV4BEP6_9GAMM
MAIVIAGAGCQAQSANPANDDGGRFYEGFGNYHRAASTDSPQAQRWFDQGMQLLYGFNHDEAIRSFQNAAAADDDFAMAWWGAAYAHGLHINNPQMTEIQSQRAHAAAQEAMKRIEHASPAEQALIRAVNQRYAMPIPEDRSSLDRAYADAMQAAWKAHPADPDVGTLYAESLMNLQPWDLWTRDGKPKGRTPEIVATLERVMEIHPDHPGANHFYIHAIEASPTPERAVAAADRLGALVPGSGHLVHMPAHIYARVGRWADASDANVKAVAADRAYFAVAPAPEFYSLYYVHNLHFLAWSAMMEGRYQTAMQAANELERDIPESFLKEWTYVADGFLPVTYHVMLRFGKWDQILAAPEPADYRLVSRASRHYARGVALAAMGDIDAAQKELDAFELAAAKIPADWLVGNNKANDVMAIALHMLRGELAFREGKTDDAFVLLRKGIALEDALAYDEPPGWMQPVRHALGALLLAEKRPEEAEAVYSADLAKYPENGWALLGLQQSLASQGKNADATKAETRLATTWTRADVKPVASCYCHPDAR